MWSKRILCRKVLEDDDALLIISVEFGALFYHHWTGSYWGMNFDNDSGQYHSTRLLILI